VAFVVGHTWIEAGPTPVVNLDRGPNSPMVWQQFPAEQYPSLYALLSEFARWNVDREFDFGLHALFQSLF